MAKILTYGRLYDKLAEFGYNQRTLTIRDQPARVFEHKTIDHAMIVLPDRDRNDVVEPFYMGSVLLTLKSRHIVPEYNPLTD